MLLRGPLSAHIPTCTHTVKRDLLLILMQARSVFNRKKGNYMVVRAIQINTVSIISRAWFTTRSSKKKLLKKSLISLNGCLCRSGPGEGGRRCCRRRRRRRTHGS